MELTFPQLSLFCVCGDQCPVYLIAPRLGPGVHSLHHWLMVCIVMGYLLHVLERKPGLCLLIHRHPDVAK